MPDPIRGADLQVCSAGIRAGVFHLIHKYVAHLRRRPLPDLTPNWDIMN